MATHFEAFPRELPSELDDDAEALAALGVYDVIIGRADIGDGELWQAVITLGGRGFSYSYCWTLGPQATEVDARAAVVSFLRGVVRAHAETIERFPPLQLPDAMRSDVYRAQRDAFRDGLDRAWPDGEWRAVRPGHDPFGRELGHHYDSPTATETPGGTSSSSPG